MFQDKYVFAQLTAFLNRTQFDNYVRKYDGNAFSGSIRSDNYAGRTKEQNVWDEEW